MSIGSSPMHAPERTDVPGPETAARHYRAFISYSHADTKWANWLMAKLEGYRVPRRFHGRRAPVGLVGPRLAPVFRDRDELPTTSDLGETIRNALRESETLVVICSPRSARSRWVQEEIKAFKRLHGPHRVFAFIVEGEPKHEGADDDCFPIALRRELGPDGELSGPPAEVVAADAREHGDGPKLAFVRLVAGLLGVGFDELRQRELQRRQRRLTLITAASVVGMAITLGLAIAAWRAKGEAQLARNDAQRRQAQAEDLLGFMLVDFRLQLEKVGRLELMESVGDKAKAYVDSLGERDLTDTTLSGKVKALTVIGIVHAQKLHAKEAMQAFEQACVLAEAIVRRHPVEGGALFDRAQAEYWILNMHYTRRDIATARDWAVRYRDTSVALVGLEPGNPRWQREAVSGHHNLAVIELERGKLAAARSGFLRELPILEKMATADPKNTELPGSIANVVSYLGTIAERSGDLFEAIARFEEQTKRLEALVKADPRTAKLQERLANACALQANVLAVTGRAAEALALRTRGRALLSSLISADPANNNYQRAELKIRLQSAMLTPGDAIAVRKLVDSIRLELEPLAKLAPADRRIVGLLAVAWRLDAGLRAVSEAGEAAECAARALTLLEPLLAKAPQDEELAGDFFSACVVAGRMARDRGDIAAAGRHWLRVVDGVQPRLNEIANWRLLDPAARALAFLGRTDEARTLIERLERAGYRPLDPWPDGAGRASPPQASGSTSKP
ncbi:MAG: TIR domain-containing protein [Verrucomicrobia bacterium]|nr:TIR domain-containing protein [Verrucomicrobiota bacterium]